MDKIIQLKGPFLRDEELIDKKRYSSIRKISVLSKSGHIIYINGELFEIGKTDILEAEGTDISSLAFAQDEDENTYIDFISS